MIKLCEIDFLEEEKCLLKTVWVDKIDSSQDSDISWVKWTTNDIVQSSVLSP